MTNPNELTTCDICGTSRSLPDPCQCTGRVHDPLVHPVDCPARPEGAATCDTYTHSQSYGKETV